VIPICEKLEEIAAQCEAAPVELQYKMLERAFYAIFGEPIAADSLPPDEMRAWAKREGEYFRKLRAEAYESAALMLKPVGWRMAALCERDPWFCRLETLDFESVTWGKGEDWITDIVAGQETTAKAASAGLSLAAASCRAIAVGRE